MKKIVLYLVVVVMIFSIFNVSALNIEKEESTEMGAYDLQTYNDAQTLMLGLKKENVFGDDSESILTRAQFLAGIMQVFNIKLTNTDVKFDDVDENNANAGYIGAAADLGLISMSDKFYPDDEVTFEQALKLALSAAGYNDWAEFKGGFPTGYLYIANDLKLLKKIGLNNSGKVTVGEATILAYELLDSPVCVQTSFGKSSSFEKGDETYLEKIYDISKFEGVVSTVDYSSLLADTPVPVVRNTIKISGVEYTYNHPNVNLLGKTVNAYVDKRNNLVCAVASDKNKEINLTADEYVEIKNGFFYHYENNSVRGESLAPLYKVVYNGRRALEGITDEMIKNDYSDIRLLDSDGDGKYDVVFVDEYTYMTISNLDYFTDYISFDDAPDRFIDLSGSNDVICDVYNENGDTVNLYNLNSDMFVGVKTSLDKSVNIIRICSPDTISGTVSDIDYSEKKITIDGETYDMSNLFVEKYLDTDIINIGDNISVYSGLKGELEYLEDTFGKLNYGLLADAVVTGGLDGIVKFKLYTSGGMKIYEAAEHMSVDSSKKIKNVSEIYDNVKNHISSPEVIKYSLDADNKISHIDFYDDQTLSAEVANSQPTNAKDSLVKYRVVSKRYRSGVRSIVGIGLLENAVIIADRGPDIDEADRYSFMNCSGLFDNKIYNMELYDVDANGYVGCAFVTAGYDGSAVNHTMDTYMIELVRKAVNDDENGYKIVCCGRGTYKSLFLPLDSLDKTSSGSIREPQPGDLIRYTIKDGIVIDEYYLDFAFEKDKLYDASGNYTDVSMCVFGNSTSGTHMYNNTTAVGASFPNAGFSSSFICDPDGINAAGFVTGRVYESSKSLLLYDANVRPDKDTVRTYVLPTSTVLFDVNSSVIKPYTTGGIKSYVANQENCDFVVLKLNSGKTLNAFVYRGGK